MNRPIRLLSIVFPIGLLILLPSIASAQITPDSTLRNERSVVRSGRISGGAIRNNSLFHSFQEFNVRNRQRVYFDNPSNIQYIFTRITGRNPSFIRGTLGVDGAANLVFINPNGIVFGSNARLDLNGSFIGSTASSIRLAGGQQFSATNPGSPPSSIRIDVPIGLQFGRNVEGIRVNSIDLVPTSNRVSNSPRTFALIGGELNFERGVLRTEDNIRLGSFGRNSRVRFVQRQRDSEAYNFDFYDRSIRNFEDINLNNNSFVLANGGGSVVMRASNITIEGGSTAGTTTLQERNAGDITLRASNDINVRGDRTLVAADVQSNSRGNGGDLTILTRNLTVENGAQVSTTTFGAGNGGNLLIRAASVVVRNDELATGTNIYRSGLFTRSGNVTRPGQFPVIATGDAGILTIRTRQLTVDRATITTDAFSQGNPGLIDIRARDSIQLLNGSLLSGVQNQATNLLTGGDLSISTDELVLRNSSLISVSNNRRIGDAGNIEINANLVLASPIENSDITSNAREGSGGQVTVIADNILGIVPRDALTSSSEITAISQRGTEGAVIFNTTNTDLSRGLVELPIPVINSDNLIARRCQPTRRLATNQIIITGRDALSASLVDTTNESQTEDLEAVNNGAQEEQYIEAQGWRRDDDGTVGLRATYNPSVLYSSWRTPTPCNSSDSLNDQ